MPCRPRTRSTGANPMSHDGNSQPPVRSKRTRRWTQPPRPSASSPGCAQAVHQQLHRQGAVVGISGGVDSSVVLALCARAFGPERVVGHHAARSRIPARTARALAQPGGRALRRDDRHRGHHPGAGRLRLLPAPRRGHRAASSREYGAGLEGQDRAAGEPAGAGDAQRLLT